MIRSHVLLAALLGLGLGCSTTSETPTKDVAAPTEPTPAKPSAAQTLTELERRLQDADRVELAFEIVSEGTVASQLKGTLVWSRDGELRLLAKGEFAGQPQQLDVRADATTLEVRVGGESRHSGPRPAKLVEAVVLGLLRQGVLHNLAMATGGQPPSFGDGGFDAWMRTIEHRHASEDTLEFDIEVEGQNIGHAALQLNAEGLPLEREQTVDFPEGQMRVVERYTIFAVNPPEPVVKVPSVLDRLRAEFEGETVVIATDRQAVLAVGSNGHQVELARGDYADVYVDTATQTLWLTTGWSKQVPDGYYLVDLSEPEFEPVSVLPMPAGVEVIHVLPSGASRVVVIEDHPWATLFVGSEFRTDIHRDRGCDSWGCDISNAALPLLEEVYQRREVGQPSVEIPDRSAYSVIESEARCSKCGRFIPIPHTEIGLISVFTRAHYSHVLWMLYDPKSDDYISEDDPEKRWHGRPPKGHDLAINLVNKIFVCNPGGGLIVDYQFMTSDLQTIFRARGGPDAAACLEGGWRFDTYDVLDVD